MGKYFLVKTEIKDFQNITGLRITLILKCLFGSFKKLALNRGKRGSQFGLRNLR